MRREHCSSQACGEAYHLEWADTSSAELLLLLLLMLLLLLLLLL